MLRQKRVHAFGHRARSRLHSTHLRVLVYHRSDAEAPVRGSHVKRPNRSSRARTRRRLTLSFVLLPRRWVVERSFDWLARFRRLSRDYERLPGTLAGLHWLAFSSLMLRNLFKLIALST